MLAALQNVDSEFIGERKSPAAIAKRKRNADLLHANDARSTHAPVRTLRHSQDAPAGTHSARISPTYTPQRCPRKDRIVSHTAAPQRPRREPPQQRQAGLHHKERQQLHPWESRQRTRDGISAPRVRRGQRRACPSPPPSRPTAHPQPPLAAYGPRCPQRTRLISSNRIPARVLRPSVPTPSRCRHSCSAATNTRHAPSPYHRYIPSRRTALRACSSMPTGTAHSSSKSGSSTASRLSARGPHIATHGGDSTSKHGRDTASRAARDYSDSQSRGNGTACALPPAPCAAAAPAPSPPLLTPATPHRPTAATVPRVVSLATGMLVLAHRHIAQLVCVRVLHLLPSYAPRAPYRTHTEATAPQARLRHYASRSV